MMLTTLLILRWLGIVAWVAVLVRLSRPTVRAFSPSPRTLDPFWAAIFLMVLNRLAYQGSGLLFPKPPESAGEAVWRLFLQLWSIGLAGMVLWLKRLFKVQHDA